MCYDDKASVTDWGLLGVVNEKFALPATNSAVFKPKRENYRREEVDSSVLTSGSLKFLSELEKKVVN